MDPQSISCSFYLSFSYDGGKYHTCVPMNKKSIKNKTFLSISWSKEILFLIMMFSRRNVLRKKCTTTSYPQKIWEANDISRISCMSKKYNTVSQSPFWALISTSSCKGSICQSKAHKICDQCIRCLECNELMRSGKWYVTCSTEIKDAKEKYLVSTMWLGLVG